MDDGVVRVIFFFTNSDPNKIERDEDYFNISIPK